MWQTTNKNVAKYTTNMYICICIYVYMYTYNTQKYITSIYIYMYIYIYIYIFATYMVNICVYISIEYIYIYGKYIRAACIAVHVMIKVMVPGITNVFEKERVVNTQIKVGSGMCTIGNSHEGTNSRANIITLWGAV